MKKILAKKPMATFFRSQILNIKSIESKCLQAFEIFEALDLLPYKMASICGVTVNQAKLVPCEMA